MKKGIFLLLCICLQTVLFAQSSLPRIDTLTSGKKTSLRGMSVVNDNVAWVSGSNGTVGRTINGGKDWKWFKVSRFDTADFRDIQAFDATTAIIMVVGEPAYILRTTDGGESWKVVYENKTKGMFLDGMEFWNSESGIVIGDPIDGKLFIARTFDGGHSWRAIPEQYRPSAADGEAIFAASGTSIRALDRDEAVFVTGGKTSKVYIRDQKINLPILQGKSSTGAFSIAVWDHQKRNGGKKMIVVGGDYAADTVASANCFYTTDRGQTWKAATKPPSGYKSCVEYITENEVIACGTSGVDYSFDGGKNWTQISKEPYHVVLKAKEGKAVYLAGCNGRVAKLVR
ncbi:MAG: oxidoreductase [Chitinophagaceae bacterium]|nr:MAG: oxidoreductase [Chitinophagaceae bacterium]